MSLRTEPALQSIDRARERLGGGSGPNQHFSSRFRQHTMLCRVSIGPNCRNLEPSFFHECTLDYDRSAFVVSSIDSENYRRFSRPDPETYFRVTALANDENMTPEKIRNGYLLKRGRKDLVYDLTKGQFLVLSGYRGQNIFYTKIALSGDNKTICVLDIFYPRKLRRSMDSEVTRMSQSFAAKN